MRTKHELDVESDARSLQLQETTEGAMSKYFSMKKATDDVKSASGAVDTTLATAVLVGKGLINAANFTMLKVLPAVANQAIDGIDRQLKDKDLPAARRKELLDKKREYEIKSKNLETYNKKIKDKN